MYDILVNITSIVIHQKNPGRTISILEWHGAGNNTKLK